MKIKSLNATRGFTDPDSGKRIKFNSDGQTDVEASLGKELVKEYDFIEEIKSYKATEVKTDG